MIQLMLNNLCRKAREYLLFFLKRPILITHGNQIVTGRFSHSRQGQTPFLRLVRHNPCNHTGIEHFRIYTFIKKADDAFY